MPRSKRVLETDISLARTHNIRLSGSGPREMTDQDFWSRVVSRRDFLVLSGSCLGLVLASRGQAFGGAARQIKVGFILSDQGPTSREAQAIVTGFEFFLKEKELGCIEILRADGGPTDDRTLEALTDLLVNRKVDFVVSPPSLDGAEKAVHGLSGKAAILFVTNPSVRLVGGEICLPTVFRLTPNTYQAAAPLAPWAIKNLGTKAFITGQDDAVGNEEADFFAHAFERAGGTFADRIMLAQGSGKIKPVLEAIEKSKPDFVFAAFRQKYGTDFIKALRTGSSQNSLPIVGPETLSGFPDYVSTLGKLLPHLNTLSCLKDPMNFVARVKEVTGDGVGHAERAAEGYDIAHMVYRAACSDYWDSKDVTSLVHFLEKLSIEGPRGTVVFDKNHEPILEFVVQEWRHSGKTFERKILENVGPFRSLDFGCGLVGFPKKNESEVQEEAIMWDEPIE